MMPRLYRFIIGVLLCVGGAAFGLYMIGSLYVSRGPTDFYSFLIYMLGASTLWIGLIVGLIWTFRPMFYPFKKREADSDHV